MTEKVREFEKALREDEELRKKYIAELNRIIEAGEAASDVEAMAKTAAALDYDLTAADFEKASAATQELDVEEMGQMAGGWCWGDYGCYTAWNHNDKDGTCWSNHSCMVLDQGPACTGIYYQCPYKNATSTPDWRKKY